MWYEWRYLDQIRPFITGPMLVKGILTAEDALLCLEHGAQGIIVSNHGGRSLDYGPSTLEVLPEIVDAVRGRVPVLVDSGFRRGADVMKALALGANAVCLGRATRWGLGAFGIPGAQRVIEMVQAELVAAMAAAGRRSLADLDRTALRVRFTCMARQTRRELLTRVAPRDELVNVPEFEAEAERVLPADVFRLLSGSDRAAFERITFRPRMMVNCLDLNLSLDLFGVPLFAPILVGPVVGPATLPPGRRTRHRARRLGRQGRGRRQQPVVAPGAGDRGRGDDTADLPDVRRRRPGEDPIAGPGRGARRLQGHPDHHGRP